MTSLGRRIYKPEYKKYENARFKNPQIIVSSCYKST